MLIYPVYILCFLWAALCVKIYKNIVKPNSMNSTPKKVTNVTAYLSSKEQ